MSHAAEAILLFLLAVVALPAMLSCAYLGIAVLLSRRMPSPVPNECSLRFDILVPAHDETMLIARCVASLQRLNWPRDRFRVIVVADNCTDTTAVAARRAGARVLQRIDPQQRGKGYALQLGLHVSQVERWADAAVVIDADSEVSPDLLAAFAARVERGAHVIQARYGVLNPAASWRTRLMAIAQASFHDVRSRARERLLLSCGIRGNGWCLTRYALRRVPYAAFSLAEDVEYGIDLGLAGLRVWYADDASVACDAVCTSGGAGEQRRRWELGRRALRRSCTRKLLLAAARRRSRVCLDLALDLLVPPLSRLALMITGVLLASLIASQRNELFDVFLGASLACAVVLLTYVLRGWQLSNTGVRGLFDLAYAPVFVLWKMAVMLNSRGPREWIRTPRKGP